MVDIYGIKNCDTMKKALNWLKENDIDFVFHDYKKEGADKAIISAAIKEHGWENVINRKGMSWRKLSEDVKASMDDRSALSAVLENPSLIKRPLILRGNKSHLGFKAEVYEDLF